MIAKGKLSKWKLLVIVIALLFVSVCLWVIRPTYTSQFKYDYFYYNCSRPIWGLRIGMVEGEFSNFIPLNQNEFNKFCRQNLEWLPLNGGNLPLGVEYTSVIEILKRKDVHDVIEKYDTTQAWVRALKHMYIEDKDYLRRILPAYSHVKIDCIIVVHSPEGTRFFIEDGEVHESHDDHQYREIPAEEFLMSLNQASDTDVTNFWLGLH